MIVLIICKFSGKSKILAFHNCSLSQSAENYWIYRHAPACRIDTIYFMEPENETKKLKNA